MKKLTARFLPYLLTEIIVCTLCAVAQPAALPQSPYTPAEFHVSDPAVLASKVCPLTGPWDFYWETFVPPVAAGTAPDVQVVLPSYWNEYALPAEKHAVAATGKGSGSYRLLITGLKPRQSYAFSVYDVVSTAVSVYANGEFVLSGGRPAQDWRHSVGDQKMAVAVFSSNAAGEVDLLLHVSNSFYRKGGIWSSIMFGEEECVRRLFNHQLCRSFLFLGTLFTVILYSLSLYIFRKREAVSMYLVLFAFVMLLRISAADFSVLKLYIPAFPYSWLLKIEYTALFLGPVFFALYSSRLYRGLFSEISIRCIVAAGILLAATVYVLPIRYANYFVLPGQIYMSISSLFIFASLVMYFVRYRTPPCLFSICTVLFLFAGSFHDVLSGSLIPIFLPDEQLLPYGFILFIFFQAAITAYQHEQTEKAVEKLSAVLVETNNAYYRFVPKEFLELLSKKNITDVTLGEWITKDMMLLSADIRGFTAISETLDGKNVFDLLNMYLVRVAPVIRRNGGFIEKYLGDGIIALFPENPKNAVACALEMQHEMETLRKELAEKQLPLIRIGIGLHFGKVVLGTVGVEDRMNEITVSRAIETVMAVEASTKQYQVPVVASADAVHAVCSGLAPDAAEYRLFDELPLGTLSVSGYSGKTELFQVRDAQP